MLIRFVYETESENQQVLYQASLKRRQYLPVIHGLEYIMARHVRRPFFKHQFYRLFEEKGSGLLMGQHE